MKHLTALLTLLITVTSFSPSFAKGVDPYFAKDSIPPSFLTKPLAPQSKEWNEEVDGIIALQRNYDEKEVAKAIDEKEITTESMLTAIEPGITREKFPLTYNLLDRAIKTSRGIGSNAKDFWGTKRPYIADKRVKSLIGEHDTPSYPSGHTVRSYSLAYAASLLFPDKQDAFLARAKEIAEHRVLIGMHYPHDLQGGREMALLVVGGLLQNKEFMHDVEAARKELKKAVN